MKKKKYYEPELGQISFGNPWAKYDCPEFVEALLAHLLNEISRVFWNRYQKEWNERDNPCIEGIEFRSYYWGGDKKEAKKPNFKFKNIKIFWYKYPHRGISINKEMSEKKWREWFDNCMKAIRRADVNINKIK